MNWTNEDIKNALNLDNPNSVAMTGAVVRYVAGCITRERNRIAAIIESATDPSEMAAAIRDTSNDGDIFIWKGPKDQKGE